MNYEDLGKVCPKCGAFWTNCPPENYYDWWQCEHCKEYFECYFWQTPDETADMWIEIEHYGPELAALLRAEYRLQAETVLSTGMRLKFFGRYGDYDWQQAALSFRFSEE